MNWRPILATFARLAVLAIVVQAGTIWVCSNWFWSPIQRHYLPAYFWSSLPAVSPSMTEVRLIWKTRPHLKPELATEDDAIASDGETGMALSHWARDAGWTGLTEGPPQQASTAILRLGLADLAFEGESFWGFILPTEACAMAAFCFTLLGWFCLRGWCQLLFAELAWRRRVYTWRELSPMLIEECVALAQRASSGAATLHRSAMRPKRKHSAIATTHSVVVKPTPKPTAFAFPLFGVFNGTGEGSYRWNERNEIE